MGLVASSVNVTVGRACTEKGMKVAATTRSAAAGSHGHVSRMSIDREFLAMEMDEENDEYIADFASFALECRRIPVAVKEFQRYAKRLELADIPVDDADPMPMVKPKSDREKRAIRDSRISQNKV